MPASAIGNVTRMPPANAVGRLERAPHRPFAAVDLPLRSEASELIVRR
jgi:hypothetical protein